ncbi:hypothetical protein SAMN06265350_102165 [Solitalea koreensis]|uniref:Uncharacterized protein n=1 Tax=Solitalea koreensis TaxID=543615 RepID=A0A521BFS7_9SPHI|nr:hypothetical protein SAMN06265350_102165 [Solitalea koreensis]
MRQDYYYVFLRKIQLGSEKIKGYLIIEIAFNDCVSKNFIYFLNLVETTKSFVPCE